MITPWKVTWKSRFWQNVERPSSFCSLRNRPVALRPRSGDTLAIFRCLLALEKQELAETAEFGKLFADAFAAAGRDDLAEVVKAEWESEGPTESKST